MSKHTYLVKALRAYRHTTYGQFDQETHYTVQETQDAANAIETLERERTSLRDFVARVSCTEEGGPHTAAALSAIKQDARALLATLPQ